MSNSPSKNKVIKWKKKMDEYRKNTSKNQFISDLKKAGFNVNKKDK